MHTTDANTRQRILDAALKRFAECGYAGTSVQDIVDDAQVTKPTLYYYFQNKAGLYQAIIDWAHDERYRVIRQAAQRGTDTQTRLVEILAAVFEFLSGHRELMRLAFATAFAARGEIPPEIQYLPKCERNFEFLHSIMQEGLSKGELDPSFDSRQLTMGLLGQMNIHVMGWLMEFREPLTRQAAENVVHLFFQGAAPKPVPVH